jgi:hypothetical protein
MERENPPLGGGLKPNRKPERPEHTPFSPRGQARCIGEHPTLSPRGKPGVIASFTGLGCAVMSPPYGLAWADIMIITYNPPLNSRVTSHLSRLNLPKTCDEHRLSIDKGFRLCYQRWREASRLNVVTASRASCGVSAAGRMRFLTW